eukprot:483960-Pelagomonas_calceolata.AAC.4
MASQTLCIDSQPFSHCKRDTPRRKVAGYIEKKNYVGSETLPTYMVFEGVGAAVAGAECNPLPLQLPLLQRIPLVVVAVTNRQQKYEPALLGKQRGRVVLGKKHVGSESNLYINQG